MKWTKKTLAARAWFAAGRLFEKKCPKCGESMSEIADKCTAEIDELCPGYWAVETAYREFENNYSRLMGQGRATAEEGTEVHLK